MIVDDPARLKMRIHRDRTHVLHAAFLQVPAHFVRQTVPCRDLPFLMSGIEVSLSICKSPDIFAERAELFPDLPEALCVMYHRFDLSSGADHPFRIQDPLYVLLAVLRHLIKIKLIKTFPEYLTFLYHHIPVQPALHDFHHQKLKLLLIVMERHAPFLIMVAYHLLITCTPGASVHRITSPSRFHCFRFYKLSLYPSLIFSSSSSGEIYSLCFHSVCL